MQVKVKVHSKAKPRIFNIYDFKVKDKVLIINKWNKTYGKIELVAEVTKIQKTTSGPFVYVDIIKIPINMKINKSLGPFKPIFREEISSLSIINQFYDENDNFIISVPEEDTKYTKGWKRVLRDIIWHDIEEITAEIYNNKTPKNIDEIKEKYSEILLGKLNDLEKYDESNINIQTLAERIIEALQ